MDIKQVRDNLKQIDTSSIISLLSNVLLYNIDSIDAFDSSRMYYKDDVVYMYDSTESKHKLFICTVNKVDPGDFNATQWDAYVFRLNKSTVYLDSSFTAASDGVSVCAINQPLFDYTRDTLNVIHSVRGRLLSPRDWSLSADKLSVVLNGFTLYKNETLIFEVIK